MATERPSLVDPQVEVTNAKALAARYRAGFVDLKDGRVDLELLRLVPVDMMFRYNFVPVAIEKAPGGAETLEIAVADPRNLQLIDELSVLLKKRLRVRVAALHQITELLKKTEQSQRVLEEVTEGFALDVVGGDEENPDETLSIDRISAGKTTLRR
jgi:type IV pilus assembly protein PilB